MGNRAAITAAERKIGLHLHWNGGRDTVEPLLRHRELKGYRAPSADNRIEPDTVLIVPRG